MSNNEARLAHVVELGADNTVTLPDDIARMFTPADRFLVTMQGDTVILKRIDVASYLDRVAATPDDEPPLTVDDISEIVHTIRRQHTEDA